MIEWNKVKLGEIASVTSSKRIFANEYQTEGIPFYRGKEIIEKHNGHEVSTELFITRERYEEIKSKFDVPRLGDILLSSVGTLGVPWLVDEEEFYFKDGNLTWLRCNESTTSEFLYLWLNSPEAKKQIDSMCIGSTQKALTIESIKKFNVILPPLDVQKKICSMVNPISEKINVNNAINRNLSEQADCLFEEWIKSCDSEISIGDMADNIIDYNVGEHKQVVLVNSSDVTEGHFEHHNLSENVDLKGHFKKAFKKWDILYSEIRPRNKHYAYCQFDPDGYIASTRLMIIRNKPEMVSSSMLYQYLMLRNVFEEFTLKTESRSGTFPQGRYEDMAAIKVPYSIDNQEEVASALDSIYAILWKNEVENRRLSGLRDSLLPKLMSGELDVSDLEI